MVQTDATGTVMLSKKTNSSKYTHEIELDINYQNYFLQEFVDGLSSKMIIEIDVIIAASIEATDRGLNFEESQELIEKKLRTLARRLSQQ